MVRPRSNFELKMRKKIFSVARAHEERN